MHTSKILRYMCIYRPLGTNEMNCMDINEMNDLNTNAVHLMLIE